MKRSSVRNSITTQRRSAPSAYSAVKRGRCGPRRGVASVLAMMFMVIFGSLAAVMAVVAHGNLRTANSALEVSRSMSAAETGMVFGAQRLRSEARRFVVEKGVIDEGFSERLWLGTYTTGDGEVTILPPGGYPPPATPPQGIVHAIRDVHLLDSHQFDAEPGDQSLPEINQYGTLRVKPIALSANDDGSPNPDGPYFRLRYELLTNGNVRIVSQGVHGSVQRTLQMDFDLTKRIEYAVLSPNRIMIGKNVLVEGPIGARYGLMPGELDCANCQPLLMRSDFYFLDPALDSKLDTFFAKVADYDVAGDGRLRPNHPVESQGLAGTGFVDVTGDGFVDDYDIFLQHYDGNGDAMVVYDGALAAAAGNPTGLEFTADPQLARLIDNAVPDRDYDGEITSSDTLLGYKDGVLDGRDRYAKVRATTRSAALRFAITREDWEIVLGESYQASAVHGAIRTPLDQAAVEFGVPVEEMLEITTDMFATSHDWFDSESQSGAPFEVQVSSQGGTVPPAEVLWEEVPWGSPGPYDWYQRPVYRDMTFTNVRIPIGTNALFENCIFVGVTFIETDPDCTHENWNYVGSVEYSEQPPGSGIWGFHPKFPGMTAEDGGGSPVSDTKPLSNNIRFHDCTFLGSVSGITPKEYTHWRNKIQMTGETRFYLDPDDPDLNQQPDAAVLKAHLNSLDPAAVEEMAKSSILMPGWSMDVGAFISDPGADPADVARVKLQGLIIAGILDIRGKADVHGTLLMTYRPKAGQGPLHYYGGCSPCMAAMNTTIGYFGPGEGDGEGIAPGQPGFDGFGEITLRYNPHAKLPDGVPWPIQALPLAQTYVEGGS